MKHQTQHNNMIPPTNKNQVFEPDLVEPSPKRQKVDEAKEEDDEPKIEEDVGEVQEEGDEQIVKEASDTEIEEEEEDVGEVLSMKQKQGIIKTLINT